MKARLFTMLSGVRPSLKVKHYVGVPPELTDGVDKRTELGPPLLLVIEERPDGVFLYRYDARGGCVGDTWHMNIGDAKHQAAYEYEDLVQEWQDVPPEVQNIIDFGLARIQSGNSR